MKNAYFLFLITIGLLLVGCAVEPNIGYTNEPTKVEEKIGAQTHSLEVLLLSEDRAPLSDYKVSTKTSEGEEFGFTSEKGVTRLTVIRKEAEPILFIFQKGGIENAITVRSLPTNFDSAGLVFISSGPGKIKLSHFAIEGLYR